MEILHISPFGNFNNFFYILNFRLLIKIIKINIRINYFKIVEKLEFN